MVDFAYRDNFQAENKLQLQAAAKNEGALATLSRSLNTFHLEEQHEENNHVLQISVDLPSIVQVAGPAGIRPFHPGCELRAISRLCMGTGCIG